jgi:hypothetical protein
MHACLRERSGSAVRLLLACTFSSLPDVMAHICAASPAQRAAPAAAPPPQHINSGWPASLAAAADALRIPHITFRPIQPEHTMPAPVAPPLHIAVPSVANSAASTAAAAAAVGCRTAGCSPGVQGLSPFALMKRHPLQHQQPWQQQHATVGAGQHHCTCLHYIGAATNQLLLFALQLCDSGTGTHICLPSIFHIPLLPTICRTLPASAPTTSRAAAARRPAPLPTSPRTTCASSLRTWMCC